MKTPIYLSFFQYAGSVTEPSLFYHLKNKKIFFQSSNDKAFVHLRCEQQETRARAQRDGARIRRVCLFIYLSSLTLLPGVEWSVVWQILNADTIWDQLVLRLELFVLLSLELGEAPFV